ncbi:hypothetical protein [Bradyrhizobium sp.]|uniref:hypothetical protein n=1 Tax=Bradyrhizobium sp. TaxID=376 RepID=UPI0039E28D09
MDFGVNRFAAAIVVAGAISAIEARSAAAEDAARQADMVTHSSPTEKYSYSLEGYQVSSNAWGAGKLVEGRDFSTSVTFNPGNFQKGTSFSWKYPRSVGGVYAYPHIDFGSWAARVSSTQGANMVRLASNYSVYLSNRSSSTVAFDFWFNSLPKGGWSTTSVELLIEVHATDRGKPNQPFSLKSAGFEGGSVYVSNMSAAGANWKFINVKTRADVMSGTLVLSDLIKELIWNGVLTGQEYLASLQFGSEVRGGTGTLQIDKLSYDWTANPTILGTSGDDTLSTVPGGGNHVVGNGGADTAVYAGQYSNYQIKSAGPDVLILTENKISSLDLLRGVAFIRFSDGEYDVARGRFVAGSSQVRN